MDVNSEAKPTRTTPGTASAAGVGYKGMGTPCEGKNTLKIYQIQS
jgi:hypothetical protein